jgi:hypothetical protein
MNWNDRRGQQKQKRGRDEFIHIHSFIHSFLDGTFRAGDAIEAASCPSFFFWLAIGKTSLAPSFQKPHSRLSSFAFSHKNKKLGEKGGAESKKNHEMSLYFGHKNAGKVVAAHHIIHRTLPHRRLSSIE